MIGWTVNASSSSGLRGSRIRLRSAMMSVSVTSRLMRRPPRRIRRRLLGGMAGQRQEHVVERRPAQVDVLDADPLVGEAAAPPRDHAAAGAHRHADQAVLGHRRVIGHGRQRRDGAVAVVGSLELDLDALAADAVLELVRRAGGDHPAVIDDRDRVGQAIGLVQVLGRQQHGGPLCHQSLDRLPQRDPAARVKAGGGLVEKDDGRLGHERPGQVQPAAHAARVGAGHAVSGVGEVKALEQLGAAALGGRARGPVQAARPWSGSPGR